jgi:hypothetical protein
MAPMDSWTASGLAALKSDSWKNLQIRQTQAESGRRRPAAAHDLLIHDSRGEHPMSAQLPFQVHISLNVYGTSPEHVQQALKEACDELLQGSTESNAVRADQNAGFTFKVTAMNLDDNKPSPAIPPQV